MTRTSLSALHDRLSRKIEYGKTIQLSIEELDWLVVSGAYGVLSQAAVAEAVRASRARLEALGEDLSWLDAPSAAEEQGEESGAKAKRPRP